MKAIIIKGVGMPEKGGFLDARINGDGTVLLPTFGGDCTTVEAEEVWFDVEEPKEKED